MLRRLRITNFAIVESLELEFGSGLTVFTGETGAGKTILVEAIRLLLGGRASAEMIRTGSDIATVEGFFDPMPVTDGDTDGIDAGGSGWLRRELVRGGSSRCFAGERQVTLGTLQKLGEALADLCGQHQQQLLLDVRRHLELLDQFAESADLLTQLHAATAERAQLLRDSRALEQQLKQLADDEELRRFQIEEIRNAEVAPDEEETLQTEAKVLKNARRLCEVADKGQALLCDDPESMTVVLARLIREADRLLPIDPRWQPLVEQLATARDAVDQSAAAISDYRRLLEFNPGRLDEIEARLTELFRLKSKYGGSCEAIARTLAELTGEERSLKTEQQRLAKLQVALDQNESSLASCALKLRSRRERAATRLQRKVTGALPELGMKGARVQIRIVPQTEGGYALRQGDTTVFVHEDGSDRIEFLFEANPREGYKPLHKIASGGELSRLLLSFKGALSSGSAARLYVFDEVDSGIGGATAQLVANRITTLAQTAQVFLISHLQQMAAPADAHFLIAKRTRAGRAQITVTRLKPDERIAELARMVAGDQVTDRALAYASELADAKSTHQQ
jgi:DNA repair protein RecN (Recombination protein N)